LDAVEPVGFEDVDPVGLEVVEPVGFEDVDPVGLEDVEPVGLEAVVPLGFEDVEAVVFEGAVDPVVPVLPVLPVLGLAEVEPDGAVEVGALEDPVEAGAVDALLGAVLEPVTGAAAHAYTLVSSKL